jgi:5-methylcytosine-specific restriction endonuclease McrA
VGKLKQIKPTLGTLPPAIKYLPKFTKPFYQSKEWKALARKAKSLAGNKCCWCGSRRRIIADHIKEITDGGAKLDIANIQVLCHACHNRKTAKTKGKRARQ